MPLRASAIRVLSFDADGTLWDFEAAMRAALDRVRRELSYLVPTERLPTIDEMASLRDAAARDLRGASMETIREEGFRRLLRHLGFRDEGLVRRFTALYLDIRFSAIRLYDDVLPTLDLLGEQYDLGLLSNGNTDPERCGLPGRFRFVVFAQDHGGIEKPDPRLFEIALAEAGCPPDAMLHIGDSLEHDVAGANGVGIPSVWLNRDGRRNETAITPSLEIASLTELADRLGSSENRRGTDSPGD